MWLRAREAVSSGCPSLVVVTGASDWGTHLCAQRHIDATGLTGASGSKLKRSHSR